MTLKPSPITLPADLAAALALAYEPNGLMCKNFEKEEESEEYGAFAFQLNGLQIKFRTAKITPKKIGQFVTLWKRINGGVILPHDLDEPIDLFIVSTRQGENFGQFVFPKAILFDKGILSKDGNGGKRAMRVYPPWENPESRQAKKTQEWQLRCFFEIPAKNKLDIERMQTLFQLD